MTHTLLFETKKEKLFHASLFRVPGPGIEPGWVAPTVFETVASTDSAIRAYICGAKLGLLALICKFFILNRAVVTFFLLILQDIT